MLKEEPDWTALLSAAPEAVRTFLQRSLIKDRHRRIADIGVAQFVLAEQAGPMTPVGGTVRYDVLPDGRFLGMTREGEAASGAPDTEIRVVLNWQNGLSARETR